MFDGFTEASMKTLMLAQQETRELKHHLVGTETILLGLIGSSGLAALALKSSGINARQVRQEVEKKIKHGQCVPPVEIPFTPRAKRILENAGKLEPNQSHISTKHLLIALIDETIGNEPGGGVSILLKNKINLSNLRQKLITMNENLTISDMPDFSARELDAMEFRQ